MTPSWLDRFIDWVQRLRVPWWLLAVGYWLVASTTFVAPLWVTGTVPFGSYPALTRIDPFYIAASLIGYGWLARHARLAFDRFRPALGVDDATAAGFRHRISTLTPRMVWVVMVAGGAFAVLSLFTDQGAYAALMTTTTTQIAWGVFYALTGFALVAAVLIVRQLALVARLHREAVHLDLFRPGPLHAFAGLSARAGALMIVVVTISAAADPVALTAPTWSAVLGAMVVLAIAAFFLPLVGLSRRLRAEKRRLLDESMGRMAAIRQDLHASADSRSFDGGGDLRAMLSALSEDHDRIRKLSPWPWDTGTIRGFATTLLLPITTWLVTNLLNRALF